MKTALISGASVAGPALAYWLQQLGWRVTVVERAAHLRPGGQAIDVRGAALDVVGRMGLLEKIRGLRTRLKGMSILDNEGNEMLVGAYVLAHEIQRAGDDYMTAFTAYEARMRPYVELNQALATEYAQGEIPDEALTRAKNSIALD